MEEEANPEPTQNPNSGDSPDEIRGKIVEALKGVYDPEIPVDIYELGLVYDIELADTGAVSVKMTLTSPMCPVAESLPLEVESKIRAIPEVAEAKVEVVWDPPWSMEKMSEAAKLQLGML